MRKLFLLAISSIVVCFILAVPSVAAVGGAQDVSPDRQDQINQRANNQPACNSVSSCGLQDNPIVKDIQTIVNVLSAGVGIVVVGVIILGGIQYALAGGSAEAVARAKQRISNGFIAFATYLIIFSFLQWLIPGGLFR